MKKKKTVQIKVTRWRKISRTVERKGKPVKTHVWRKITRKVTRVPVKKKGKTVYKKPVAPKRAKSAKVEKNFCRVKTREDFYNQVLKDRAEFRDKLGEESSSAFQLWFQIGPGEKRTRKLTKKQRKNIQYTHGLRKFTNMRKARLFLAIDGIMTSGDRPLPLWKKRGKESVCQFEKTAWLVETKQRGRRGLKPKILKKYIIQE